MVAEQQLRAMEARLSDAFAARATAIETVVTDLGAKVKMLAEGLTRLG